MGKSTAAGFLRHLALPVHDADAVVHDLLAPGGQAVADVSAAFPGVEKNGGIDRSALGRSVFNDGAALKTLERLLHPRVRAAENRFLARCARAGDALVVLDIPLLYETAGDHRCDAVLVVSCRAPLQRRRVLARPGMTAARLQAIVDRQLPDSEKRRRADLLIRTDLSKAFTLRQLRDAVRLLTSAFVSAGSGKRRFDRPSRPCWRPGRCSFPAN